MRNCYAILFIPVFGIVLCACSMNGTTTEPVMQDQQVTTVLARKEPLSPEEYVKWVTNPKNGVKKQKQIGVFRFTAQYKPYEYIACLENSDKQLTDSLLNKTIQEIDAMQYYELTIARENGQGEILKHNITSPAEYDQRVKYYSFYMQKDIQLVDGRDTLPCGLYHFERTYDAVPYIKIMLGFECNKNDTSKEKILLVHDKTFNNGLLKFTFSSNTFINIPKLKLYGN